MLTATEKQELLARAQEEVKRVRTHLAQALEEELRRSAELKERLKTAGGSDRMVQERIYHACLETIEHLGTLLESPYFSRCQIRFLDTDSLEDIAIAKQSFAPERIYSWVTPVASVRFESMGRTSYKRPDGSRRPVELMQKDEFLIVRDHILFYTQEAPVSGRTLVYQEQFKMQKTDFALTDIVAQMEKAQDAVIRANPFGSLLISGPAGSGKTTLALHRLAYLAQAPETMTLFPSAYLAVFVQDASSKSYFSKLLPELGIHDVEITTFEEWAGSILDVNVVLPSVDLQQDPRAFDEFQYQKGRAIRDDGRQVARRPPLRGTTGGRYRWLEDVYDTSFSDVSRELFQKQIREGSLDRFDLTVLLQARMQEEGVLYRHEKYWTRDSKGKPVQKVRNIPKFYRAITVDEVQNYLPEQLRLLKSCVDAQTQAMLYVGDLAQQTKLCTLRDWQSIQEDFDTDRQVMLQKAYRNTKQIIRYLEKRGYQTTLQSTRDGEGVDERNCSELEDVIPMLREVFDAHMGVLCGVIALDTRTIAWLRDRLGSVASSVHVLSVEEAQGVEFPIACVVDTSASWPAFESGIQELREEQRRIVRDRLYVALTRAMESLYVFRVG